MSACNNKNFVCALTRILKNFKTTSALKLFLLREFFVVGKEHFKYDFGIGLDCIKNVKLI